MYLNSTTCYNYVEFNALEHWIQAKFTIYIVIFTNIDLTNIWDEGSTSTELDNAYKIYEIIIANLLACLGGDLFAIMSAQITLYQTIY